MRRRRTQASVITRSGSTIAVGRHHAGPWPLVALIALVTLFLAVPVAAQTGADSCRSALEVYGKVAALLELPASRDSCPRGIIGSLRGLISDQDRARDELDASARMREIERHLGTTPSEDLPVRDRGKLAQLRALLAAVPQVAPSGATAYLPPGPVSHPNLPATERSQLFFVLHGVLLEAQVAPHIIFYENLSHTGFSSPGGRAWSLFGTPQIRLRMLSVKSSPIKTLSWMPKVDFERIWNRGQRTDELGEHLDQVIAQLGWGHHSNGQDESMYYPGVRDGAPLDTMPSRLEFATINYPNGSFSTNYLQAAVFYKRHRFFPKDDNVESRQDRGTWQVGYGFEWHKPHLPFGGSMPQVFRALYGTSRHHLSGEIEGRTAAGDPTLPWGRQLLRGSWRVSAEVDYINKSAGHGGATETVTPDSPLNAVIRPGLGASRLRHIEEVAYYPDALRGWGLLARYYSGQDFYNLQFYRDIHWLQIGIAFDAAEFEPFGARRFAPAPRSR